MMKNKKLYTVILGFILISFMCAACSKEKTIDIELKGTTKIQLSTENGLVLNKDVEINEEEVLKLKKH